MQNDYDPDNNGPIFVGIATQPQHGWLSLVRPGEYTYTANAGYVEFDHNGKKKHYYPGDEIDVAPVSCPVPTTNPSQTQRSIRPLAEEARMQELSNREMETFWTKVLVGTAIAGAVYVGGAPGIPIILRFAWAF